MDYVFEIRVPVACDIVLGSRNVISCLPGDVVKVHVSPGSVITSLKICNVKPFKESKEV